MPTRGGGDIALFEVGQVFHSDEPAGQTMRASGVRRGLAGSAGVGRHWSGGGPVDAFDAKADAFALLEALAIPQGGVQVVPGGPPWFHPGRSAKLQFGPKIGLGAFGELASADARALDVKGPVVGFEITLDLLPAPKSRATRARAKLALSELQPVRRDFAFVVEKSVAAGDIVKTVQNSDRTLIADVVVFDVYEGAGLDAEQEIGRRRGDVAAGGKDAHRRRDRGGVRQDRRRGVAPPRSDAQELGVAASRYISAFFETGRGWPGRSPAMMHFAMPHASSPDLVR